jgi:WD40 repeat protein
MIFDIECVYMKNNTERGGLDPMTTSVIQQRAFYSLLLWGTRYRGKSVWIKGCRTAFFWCQYISHSVTRSMLATGDASGRVRLLDKTTGTLQWSQLTHLLPNARRTSVISVDISPNGAFVVTVNEKDDFWRTWHAESGSLHVTLDHHDGQGGCLCGVTRSHIRIAYNAACPTFAHHHAVWVARFSPCGLMIASAGDANAMGLSGDILMSSVRTGTPTALVRGIYGRTKHLSFSEDGEKLASGGTDGRIRILNTVTGVLIRWMLAADPIMNCPVSGVQFSPTNGHFLLSTTTGGNQPPVAREWNVTNGTTIQRFVGDTIARYSHNGKMIATVTLTTIRIFHRETGLLQSFFNPLTRDVRFIFFSFDGSQLTIVPRDENQLHVFNSSTGQIVTLLPLPTIDGYKDTLLVFGRDWVGNMKRREAFAMGTVERLGDMTSMQTLEQGVVKMILDLECQ